MVAGRGKGYLESRRIDAVRGGIIYAPATVRHGTGSPPDAEEVFICSGCASPPQFDVYQKAGHLKEGRSTEFAWT